MSNIKQISRIAKTEYISWLTNPRNIIAGVLLIFIKTLVIDPLAALGEIRGKAYCFRAVCGSGFDIP